MTTQTKATNPKDAIGSTKLPLHLWPATATAMGCIGLANGALKYGRGNWRAAGIRASIYVDACKRHLDAWFEGEECDPDDGAPHLAAALACLAIIVDAQAADMLTDDRQVAGGYRALVDSLTPHVARLQELHASRDPKHWTIADNVALEHGAPVPANENAPATGCTDCSMPDACRAAGRMCAPPLAGPFCADCRAADKCRARDRCIARPVTAAEQAAY